MKFERSFAALTAPHALGQKFIHSALGDANSSGGGGGGSRSQTRSAQKIAKPTPSSRSRAHIQYSQQQQQRSGVALPANNDIVNETFCESLPSVPLRLFLSRPDDTLAAPSPAGAAEMCISIRASEQRVCARAPASTTTAAAAAFPPCCWRALPASPASPRPGARTHARVD